MINIFFKQIKRGIVLATAMIMMVEVLATSAISTKACTASGAVNYMTHIERYGNQEWVWDGTMAGTVGESKRMEQISIKIDNSKLDNCSGGITYKVHCERYGWLSWKENGEPAGTTGESKRLECIKIMLTGRLSEKYDVYYRVHAEKYGWLEWVKNGEPAGTVGESKRLEAIEIMLRPKEVETTTEEVKESEVETTTEVVEEPAVEATEEEVTEPAVETTEEVVEESSVEATEEEATEPAVETTEEVVENTIEETTEEAVVEGPTGIQETQELEDMRQEILALMNADRRALGREELILDEELNKIAEVRAKETVELYSHDRPNGTKYWTVYEELGIDYTSCCGENLMKFCKSAERFYQAWYNSPGHRENMQRERYTKVGIYIYQDENGKLYAAQEFSD